MRKLAIAVLALCVVGTSLAWSNLAHTKILFTSVRHVGQSEIYIMNSDGSDPVRLTWNNLVNRRADWSPDGTKIVFERVHGDPDGDAKEEIYVMDADGSNMENVTNNLTYDRLPSFTPGGQILFFSDRAVTSNNIFRMDVDGSNVVNVTNGFYQNSRNGDTSPDGAQIAFRRGNDDIREIYMMNADGSNQVHLGGIRGDDNPTFSPSGTQLVFDATRSSTRDVWLMNVDGSSAINLTNDAVNRQQNPTWSPDGTLIAYDSAEAGPGAVFTMAPDGSAAQMITPADTSFDPSWSPLLPIISVPSTTGVGVANVGSPVSGPLTVSNTGSADLVVSNVTVDNANFSVAPTSFTVTAGGTQDVTVTFTPTASGADYGTVTVTHNAIAFAQSPIVTAPVSGIGAMPVVVPTGNLADTKITYNSSQDGDGEIYVINYDGTAETNLTNNPALERHTRWSPDGSQLVFWSDRDGDSEVYLMNADGTGPRRITNSTGFDGMADWSPDGSKLVFFSDRDGNNEIYLMQPDGTGQVNLTNNSASDHSPRWSPGGARILFVTDRDGNEEIYAMEADGRGLVNLTNDATTIDGPATWSPAGDKIAFVSVNAGTWDVYTMNVDGSDRVNVTNNGSSTYPVWSPDGTEIAYHYNDGVTGAEIYTVGADGVGVTKLTLSASNGLPNESPEWSPFLPSATITPASVYAGVVTVASDGSATFTVSNSASGDLVVTDITSDNTQFTVSPKAFTVPAGGSQDVTVTYLPTVVGWETATLSLVSNDPAGPVTIAAEGIGRMTVVVPSGDLDTDSKIAFAAHRDGFAEVYFMDPDGGNQTRVTYTGDNNSPMWSPDGSQILYKHNLFVDGAWSGSDIFIMDADGSDQTPLLEDFGFAHSAEFSPDGSKVVFGATNGANTTIHTMHADGSGLVLLVNSPGVNGEPTWSPDGSQIAFHSDRDGYQEIYVMSADGSNQTNLTGSVSADNTPVFSPDGSQIVFVSDRDGSPDIFVMGADGLNPTRLSTDLTAADTEPGWSPDGSRILYASDADGTRDTWVMDSDGTNHSRLTFADLEQTDPVDQNKNAAWSPFLTLGAPTGGALITVNDAQGQVGGTTTVSITSSALDGLGVTAIDLTLSYDPDLLTPTSDAGGATNAITVGSLIPAEWTLEQNEPSPGQIRAALAGGFGYEAPASGATDTVLITINFTVSPTATAGDTSSLLLIESELNETSVPSNVANGTFTAFDLMIGDVTGNGEITAFDGSWVLEYVANELAGTSVPLPIESKKPTWADGPLTPAQARTVADVEPSDATVTADDARYILQRAVLIIDSLPVSLPAAPALTAGAYGLHGAASGTRPGARITVSLDTQGITALHSGEMLFEFDPALLTPVSARLRDTTPYTHRPLVVNKRGEGLFAVVFTSAEALDGRSGLLDVEFEATNNVAHPARGDIRLSRLRLNRDLVEPNFSYGFTIQPYEFRLFANFPNPFNPETWISFELNAAADVVIDIYSMDGRRVRRLELGSLPMGEYADRNGAAYWDGRNSLGEASVSGLYIYQLRAGDDTAMRRMMLLK